MNPSHVDIVMAEADYLHAVIGACEGEWLTDGVGNAHVPPAFVVVAGQYAEGARAEVSNLSIEQWELGIMQRCYTWFTIGRAFQANPWPITPCRCHHERSDPNAPIDVVTGGALPPMGD